MPLTAESRLTSWIAVMLIGLIMAPVSAKVQIELRHHHGRPTVFINGEPKSMVVYSPPKGTSRFERLWRPATERFLQHDMDVYLMTVPQTRAPGRHYTEEFWQGMTIRAEPIVQAIDKVDAGPNFVLERDPGAWLMIRLNLQTNKPWAEQHPDQLVVNEQSGRLPYASLASESFNEMLAQYVGAVISYCESRPWGNRVIGYVNYEIAEGTHPPMIHHWLYDHSDVMRRRWQRFLREKYDIESLRKVYADPSLTFEQVSVPHDALEAARRTAADIPYWQDAAQNQPLRDYLKLIRELYHTRLRAMMHTMRKAAGPGKLLLYDTFKIPMQGWSNAGFFDMESGWPMLFGEIAAGSGNMSVADLFEDPGFDGLATPYDYQMRGTGGVFLPEGLADTMVLRNKLFFTEWDLRTYRGRSGLYGTVQDLETFTAVTWRDTATALTRGFTNYYCDHNADYFSDPRIHEVIARQVKVMREAVHWEHHTVPGIAMILDDTATLETNGSGHAMHEAIMWEQKLGLARCGVPYRVYLFEDLMLDNFPDHRVFYFPNLYRVDAKRLRALRDKVLRNGHVVVWGPGSGISDGQTIGAAHAERLTGFTFDTHPANYQRRVQITNFDHPITRELDAGMVFGSSIAYGPMLYPTNGTRLGLALSKRGADTTGLAVRTFGQGARGPHPKPTELGRSDYAALFTTTAPLPANLWRGIARFAGAHVYSSTNDVLLASEKVVAVHALKPGKRRIALPGMFAVIDLVSGKEIAAKTDTIEFTFTGPGTRVFFLQRMP